MVNDVAHVDRVSVPRLEIRLTFRFDRFDLSFLEIHGQLVILVRYFPTIGLMPIETSSDLCVASWGRGGCLCLSNDLKIPHPHSAADRL